MTDSLTEEVARAMSEAALANPVCYASIGQIEQMVDSADDYGTCIPLRKSSRGNFTTALYALPPKSIKEG